MTNPKRVVVTGATGLIGKTLCERLKQHGYQVVVFSRDPGRARQQLPGAAEYVAWQPSEDGAWASAIDGAHGVVSLAGASIAGKRWTESYKREIRDSRVIGTRGLVNAMARASTQPRVFVSASAIGYYGPRDDTPLDEGALPGHDFLAQVCRDWEAAASQAETLGVRAAITRNGIVLDRREGALAQLLLPFKLFVGGPIGPGTQWWSWIHLDDMVGLLMLALENEQARGPINAVAPEPERNRDFARALGRVLGRPALLPAPGFAMRILLGEMADALLNGGQRVIPRKAQALGYQFNYPSLEPALRQILRAP